MISVLLVCFLNVLVTSLTTGIHVEIKSAVESPVNFYLPTVEACGEYNFTDSSNNLILSVLRNSGNLTYKIYPLYVNRAACNKLWNGTVVFTLSHIVDSDFVDYLVKPGGKADADCWKKYSLRRENDDKYSDTAIWLSWESWSGCQATCGYGDRSRTRICSIPGMCRGENVETSTCSSDQPCDTFQWSSWSVWSACSVTCGGGDKTRYRKCMKNTISHVDNSHCVGDVIERGECAIQSCHTEEITPLQATPLYEWSTWNTWSTCSQSCGTGIQSRARTCLYTGRVIDSRYCAGESIQNETCAAALCIHDTSRNGEVVKLPLSVIIGTGSVLFIIILFVIIVVLVVKLRKKRTRTVPVFIEPPNRKQSGSSNRAYGRPKRSIVSFTSMGASNSDHYDTINDDDVTTRDRQSVITIDNPYVSMPKSPADTNPYNNDAVMYNNTHETVFMFDKQTGSGRKVSNAYQNAGSSSQTPGTHLDVPRHMSVDSVGYLMPGSATDRALKRTKKYKPKL